MNTSSIGLLHNYTLTKTFAITTKIRNFHFCLFGVSSRHLKGGIPHKSFPFETNCSPSPKETSHRSANVLKKILPIPGLPIHRVRNMELNFGGCPAVINSRSLYGREENVYEDNDWKISLDNRRGRDSFCLKNKWRRACRYCRRQPFFEFLPEIMRWYQVPSFYGMLLIFLANVELIMQMTNW